MPDYVYLLENRLSKDQRNALRQVGEAAREAGMTVFLVGGAVRDLISGSSVRDLDIAVQGNALKLKKSLIKRGAKLWGEHEASHTLFLRFPIGVSIEVSSSRREEYPKPGKPVYHWDNILQDLRRRDFTANAMALSLNEHSYGLLMDPLNGVADIEARQLRLVSNYGFIEEPARLLRATRLKARLGWELEERTKTRYENAKEQGVIESLSPYQKGYELQEIGQEEDGLRALNAMESEGWMPYLDPKWTSAKADVQALEEMHRLRTRLQMQGVNPEFSAVSMHLLTAKLQPKDLAALKKMLVRPGFIEEWDALDSAAKDFAKQLAGKDTATPSATWKVFTSADPQAVLWLGLTSKMASIQAKYTNFFTVWPEARQKIPHALMQELRITPAIPRYDEMLSQLFFGVIDGKLETEEQLRAFLAPYSPPAPPPPVTVRRSRASRKSVEPKQKVPDAEDREETDLDREEDDDEREESEGRHQAAKKPLAAKESAAAQKQVKVETGSKAEVSGKSHAANGKRVPLPAAASFPAPSKTASKTASKPNKSGKAVAPPAATAKSATAKPGKSSRTAKPQAVSRHEEKTPPLKGGSRSKSVAKPVNSGKHAHAAKPRKKAAAKKPLSRKKTKPAGKR